MLEYGWMSFFVVCIVSAATSTFCIAYLGITKDQRTMAFNYIRSKIARNR